MPRPFLSPRVAAVLAAALTLPPPLTAADPKYLPDDTERVVVVNLKQILASEVVKSQPDARGELEEVLGRFAGIHAVQKYLAEAGLNAYRDVRTVTYVYAPGKEPGPSLVILEGEFDAGKPTDAVKGGGTVLAVKSGDTIMYAVTPRGGKQVFAALVGRSTLIAAPTEQALADSLARAAGTKKSALRKEIRQSLEAMGGEQSVAFVAGGTALARLVAGAGIPNTENAAAVLRMMDVVAGGVTLGQDIRFQLLVNAEGEPTAKTLAESAGSAVRILTTLARQTAEKDEKYLPVVEVVNALRVSAEGTGVRLRGGVSLDTVEKLLANFPVSRPAKDGK